MRAENRAITPVEWKLFTSTLVTSFVPEDNVEKMISRADTALYAAKHAGQNRVELASA